MVDRPKHGPATVNVGDRKFVVHFDVDGEAQKVSVVGKHNAERTLWDRSKRPDLPKRGSVCFAAVAAARAEIRLWEKAVSLTEERRIYDFFGAA